MLPDAHAARNTAIQGDRLGITILTGQLLRFPDIQSGETSAARTFRDEDKVTGTMSINELGANLLFLFQSQGWQ